MSKMCCVQYSEVCRKDGDKVVVTGWVVGDGPTFGRGG